MKYILLCTSRDADDQYASGPYDGWDEAERAIVTEVNRQHDAGKYLYGIRIVPVRNEPVAD